MLPSEVLHGWQQEFWRPYTSLAMGRRLSWSLGLFRLSLWPLSLRALTGKLLLDWYLMKDLHPL
jgi:hypothetical protein